MCWRSHRKREFVAEASGAMSQCGMRRQASWLEGHNSFPPPPQGHSWRTKASASVTRRDLWRAMTSLSRAAQSRAGTISALCQCETDLFAPEHQLPQNLIVDDVGDTIRIPKTLGPCYVGHDSNEAPLARYQLPNMIP